MSYDIKIVKRAREMRRNGYSLGEISQVFNISKSTSSIWTSKEKLTKSGRTRIQKRQGDARTKAFQKMSLKREKMKQEINKNAQAALENTKVTPALSKILLSFLFWAEGDKNLSYLGFANSDPIMIKTFLSLLRNSFKIDEQKLRALVHIHEYHNEPEILNFWSQITGIPRNQFTKSYLKPHTGKRKKANYMGSMHLRYYNYKVARELASIYNMLAGRF